MCIVKPILKSVLTQLLELLNEDQLMHFRKIHKPVDDLTKSGLLGAIQLVERTLKHSGISYAFIEPIIKSSEQDGGLL